MGSGPSRSPDGGGRARKFRSYHLPFQKQKKFAKLKARLFGKKKKSKAESGEQPGLFAAGRDLRLASGTSASLQALPTSSSRPRPNALTTAHSQHVFPVGGASAEEIPAASERLDLPQKAAFLPMPSSDFLPVEPHELALFKKNEDPYSVVVKDKRKTGDGATAAAPLERGSSSGNSSFEDATEGDSPPEATKKLREESSPLFEDAVDLDEAKAKPDDDDQRPSDELVAVAVPADEESSDSFFEPNGFTALDVEEASSPLKTATENEEFVDVAPKSERAAPVDVSSEQRPKSDADEILTPEEEREGDAPAKEPDSRLSDDSDSPPPFSLPEDRRPKNVARRGSRKPRESDSSEERSGSVGDDGRSPYSSESDVVSDPVDGGEGKDPTLDNGDASKGTKDPQNPATVQRPGATEEADLTPSSVANQTAESTGHSPGDDHRDAVEPLNTAATTTPPKTTTTTTTAAAATTTTTTEKSNEDVATEGKDDLVEESPDSGVRSDLAAERSSRTTEDDGIRKSEEAFKVEPIAPGEDPRRTEDSLDAGFSEERKTDFVASSESSSGEQKASLSVASNSSGSDIDDDDVWDEDFQNENSAESIKTKLVLDLLKKLEVDMGDFRTFAELPGVLEDKYHVLPLREFLTTNLESEFSLDDLSRCLRVLAKYGLNLLKAGGEGEQHWRKVIVPPKMLPGHWLCVQGSKEILMELGYEESERHLVYPQDREPNVETSAAWVVEMLLAAHEINLYCVGSHPQPQMFESAVGCEGASAEEPPPSSSAERRGDGTRIERGEEEEDVLGVRASLAPRSPRDEGEDFRPISAAEAEEEEEEEGGEEGKDPRTEEEDVSDMFGRRTVVPWLMDKEKRLPEAPPQQQQQRCHLCGSSSPAVRCEKCSNLIFCVSCDDMYHRHPKRRDHSRKAVNPASSPPPLPPPRPPSKPADPNKVPVPPPRRRKSRRSLPDSPVFGRQAAADQKPELPKKQFPTLKFGSLRRFIPGANGNGPPPQSSPKHQSPAALDRRDRVDDAGAMSIDAKYGVVPGRLQESHGDRRDRPPAWNRPREDVSPRYPGRSPRSNAAEQSSSDAEEDFSGPRDAGRGSGSFVGSGPGDERWSPISSGPPLPPPYGGPTSGSLASLDRAGSYPEPGCGNSTLSRRNTMMSGITERSMEYGYPRVNYMQHSSSVCDLSNPAMAPPFFVGYRLPQVQSMANLQRGDAGPLVAPCGCRPNWIGPDAFGRWHPPVACPAHGAGADAFHPGFAPTEGTFGTLPRPVAVYPSGGPFPHRAASPAVSAGSRKKAEAVRGASRSTRRRARPPLGTTSSEEDYFSAGASDEGEDEPRENAHEADRRHQRRGDGSWQCEHCTFINEADARICNVCCKTTGRVAEDKRSGGRRSSVETETKAVKERRSSRQAEEKRRIRSQPDDDGEYEDLDDGRTNRTKGGSEKVFAKEAGAERQNSPKPPQQNAVVGPSNGPVRRGVEAATDPMVPMEEVTEEARHVRSNTQTYSSGFREKVLPASGSPSRTNGGGQKDVVSKGTSPPPQSIATQTPDADWTPPEPRKPLGRASSRMSLAGDASAELGGGHVLKRAASLHFPRSYGGGFNDGWGTTDLTSDQQHLGYAPSSGPPSRDASPPPPWQRNGISTRRESNVERGRATAYSGYSRGVVAQEDRIARDESRKDYYLSLEELVEKRRQETLRTQGLELVKLLREAEQQNFGADDLRVALNHCGSQNPVQWLRDNWKNMVDTVVTLATNYGNDKTKNDIGVMSAAEAQESLRLHKGNIWAAVTECVEQRQKRFAELGARGNFSRDEIVAALTSSRGNVELALDELNKASLKPFLMRIWGPPSGAENESGITWAAMRAMRGVRDSSAEASKDSPPLDDEDAILPPSDVSREGDVEVDAAESLSVQDERGPEEAPDDRAEEAEKSEAKDEEFFDAIPGTPSEERREMESPSDFAQTEPETLSPYEEEEEETVVGRPPSPVALGPSSARITSSATIILGPPVTPSTTRGPESASAATVVSTLRLELAPWVEAASATPRPSPEVSGNDDVDATEVAGRPASSDRRSASRPVDETPLTGDDAGGTDEAPPSERVPPSDAGRTMDGVAEEVAPRSEESDRRSPPSSEDEVADSGRDADPSSEATTNVGRRKEASSKKAKVVRGNAEPAPKVAESDLSRRARRFLAEGKLATYERAEVAVKLIDLRFDESEAIDAAGECGDLYMAISYLRQDCELCAGKFPMGKMVSMLNCVHRCCRNCAKDYFTLKIKERNVAELVCPFCDEPDLNDDDVAVDYFNNLDIVLKNLVDGDTHELFQRKLRDRALMSDPNFLWCHKCSFGFMAEPNRRRTVCPNCHVVTCAECKKPWEKQHDGISCGRFLEWKRDNDPEYQLAGLEKYLAENGIDCPKCKFKYALAKGGCMHFTCSQCKFEFCSGCGRPFRMAKNCGVSRRCERLGLHAHHPRNCLFYLRDKEPKDLLKLLDDHGVICDVDSRRSSEGEGPAKKKCPVVEQKELPDGVEDSECGREVKAGYPGLCRIHYVEYLGGVLYKSQLDPIALLSDDDLEAVIRNGGRRLPARATHVRSEEYRSHYVEYLVSLINDGALDPVTIMDVGALQQELRRKEKRCPEREEGQQDEQYRERLVQLILKEIPLEEA